MEIIKDSLLNSEPKRAFALDALRGFAILTMILSSRIPWGTLPGWMYHAQNPPPTHAFNAAIPGITWVDLVFPFFLFAMGAAFPFALSKRVKQGIPIWKIVVSIFQRGLLLAGFAIYIQHIRPHVMNPDATLETHLLALIGFAILFPIFLTLPKSFNKNLKISVRGFGYAGAILFLYFIKYPDGSGFSLYRSDIIILVLANVAVFGSLIWLFTRDNLLLRLGFLGILIAMRLSQPVEGEWVHWIWNEFQIPWLFKLFYLQYLFIVLPGTIVGDIILKWMQKPAGNTIEKGNWSAFHLWNIVVIMVMINLVILIGYYARVVTETTIITIILCGIGWWLLSKPLNETERMLKLLFQWGCYWLILGMFFEAYEGGIQKGRATVSYYFVSTALGIFVLIAFSVVIDALKKQKLLQLMIDNGQNPMIAYAGGTNLLTPLLGLTYLEPLLQSLAVNNWLGVVKGVFVTFLLALMVSFFTKKKIFWRS